MRIVAAVVLAAALFVGPAVNAEPSDDCGGMPAAANPVAPSEEGFYIRACVPGLGSLTIANEGEYGYIVADGDSGNAAISPCLDGYAGIESSTMPGDQNHVAEEDGDYSPPRNGPPSEDPDPTTCIPA